MLEFDLTFNGCWINLLLTDFPHSTKQKKFVLQMNNGFWDIYNVNLSTLYVALHPLVGHKLNYDLVYITASAFYSWWNTEINISCSRGGFGFYLKLIFKYSLLLSNERMSLVLKNSVSVRCLMLTYIENFPFFFPISNK